MKPRFKPIAEKIQSIEVVGQCVPGDGCDSDCVREYWSGNASSVAGCSIKHHPDSHWSKCH